MYRAINRVGITSNFRGTNLPPRLQPDRVTELVVLAKTGTEQEKTYAIDQLILSHIRFVGAIAARYAAKRPRKRDDILGEALSVLVETTNRIARGKLMKGHNNYAGYLQVTVSYHISRYLNEDYTVRPHSDNPKVLADEIRKDPEAFVDKYTPRELTENLRASPAPDRHFKVVMDDLVVQSQYFTEREQKIIKLRNAGFTDTEIGLVLGVSKARIGQMKEALRERLEQLTGEKS